MTEVPSPETKLLQQVEVLQTSRPRAVLLPSLRTWCHVACVSLLVFAEGFLFVFGGQDENKQTLSSGEKYDPDANTWTALPPMNEVKPVFVSPFDFSCLWHLSVFCVRKRPWPAQPLWDP